MKRILLNGACALVVLFGSASLRAGDDLAGLADQAVSTDPAFAQPARQKLRDLGPQGLQALQNRFADEIIMHKRGGMANVSWQPIGAALDQVSGQYDGYSSGLYWYTDLDKAKKAAAASGRPILSLRLLGRLDQNLSCANSRFFRTTLYPNTAVNQFLRDNFILHWESFRPVPVVTIDFGDGRKIQRTITGNSIHYILDANGTIVDALPGLYGSSTFVEELQQVVDAIRQHAQTGDTAYGQYQKATSQRLLNEWATDLRAGGINPATTTAEDLVKSTDDAAWEAVARMHRSTAAFDLPTLTLISSKFPTALAASNVSASKMAVENPMVKELRNLGDSVAMDTVRNNYMLRTKILAQLPAAAESGLSLTQFNDWVYASVFLTPKNDPWLGLAPADHFSGLDNDGVVSVSR